MQFDPCVFDLKPTCLPFDILTAPYRIAFGHLFEVWEPTNGLCEKITHLFLFVIELIPVANYGICYLDYTWTIGSFKEEEDQKEIDIYEDRHRQLKTTENDCGIEIQLVVQSYFNDYSGSFLDKTDSFSANRNPENGHWIIAETQTNITRKGSLFCRNSTKASNSKEPKEINEYLILNDFDNWRDGLKKLSDDQKKTLDSWREELVSKILSYHSSIKSVIASLPACLKQINLHRLSQDKITVFSSNLEKAIEGLEKDLDQIKNKVDLQIENVEDDGYQGQTGLLIDSLTTALDHFLWLEKTDNDFRTQLRQRMKLFKKEVDEMVTQLTEYP